MKIKQYLLFTSGWRNTNGCIDPISSTFSQSTLENILSFFFWQNTIANPYPIYVFWGELWTQIFPLKDVTVSGYIGSLKDSGFLSSVLDHFDAAPDPDPRIRIRDDGSGSWLWYGSGSEVTFDSVNRIFPIKCYARL